MSVPNSRPSNNLVDKLGRIHRSLRISVTDACNIRCQYCMPEQGAKFLSQERLLSFEQIARFVEAVVPLGLTKLRLTGGEPLLRRDLHELVRTLHRIEGVNDLALTTNGMLLAEKLPELSAAGIRRINLSLDTLSAATFRRLARRDGLDKVMAGIEAALADPSITLKMNALVLRDVNLEDVIELTEFALQRSITLRFIEFMPLDAEKAWSQNRMVSGEELRSVLARRFGELKLLTPQDSARPAREYCVTSGEFEGTVGFIDSVSKPFCSGCDRVRLTADGKVRNCLFGTEEWDVRGLLNEDRDAERLRQALRECVSAKHPAHGIADAGFEPPARAMYQIGG